MQTDKDTAPKAALAFPTIENPGEIRPEVLNYDDIRQMVPKFDGHEKLVNFLLRFLQVDEVNAVHSRWCDTPGPEFVRRMMEEDFKIKLRVDGPGRCSTTFPRELSSP